MFDFCYQPEISVFKIFLIKKKITTDLSKEKEFVIELGLLWYVFIESQSGRMIGQI